MPSRVPSRPAVSGSIDEPYCEPAHSAPLLDSENPIEGVVQRLKVDQRGNQVVLSAVIHIDSGRAVALYMAGSEVRGILEVGDHIRTEGSLGCMPDGAVRVTKVDNLSTSCTISVWTPPFGQRLAAMAGPLLLSGLISSVVGAIVAAVLGGHGAASHVGNGASEPEPFSGWPSGSSGISIGAALVIVIGIVVVAAIAFRTSYVTPRRKRRAALVAAASSIASADA
jgi:hypothetical protein